ncbi:MAG: MotA/TolQ/ExbB proton channel family protein [Chromatiales bacterium]|jgi:biopolymer transport protein ExbB|nr:MotA/TolQ/ExbB proton channel family protein [Chromatiales bacterium]MDX9766042.1 MotA/TolQ/ExbB proton channel family protein [Ectothiorhodospiraceae bacterium]
MSLTYVFEHGDAVLLTVFMILLLMSVATWYLILAKSYEAIRVRRADAAFLDAFWNAAALDEARTIVRESASPLAAIAAKGIAGFEHFRRRRGADAPLGESCSVDEFLVRTIRNAMNREDARLQSGLSVLASVGSTAPFIGLFGTVWGIYHALIDISVHGNVTMEVVAGPLGEALVATAAGLAAAIPAVLAFNAMQRFNRAQSGEMDAFAHDLHAFLTTGACVSVDAAASGRASVPAGATGAA